MSLFAKQYEWKMFFFFIPWCTFQVKEICTVTFTTFAAFLVLAQQQVGNSWLFDLRADLRAVGMRMGRLAFWRVLWSGGNFKANTYNVYCVASISIFQFWFIVWLCLCLCNISNWVSLGSYFTQEAYEWLHLKFVHVWVDHERKQASWKTLSEENIGAAKCVTR